MTAKEWKENNPNLQGNIRDNTDIIHLIILSNLEVLNAEMIKENISQQERLEKLNDVVQRQLMFLSENNSIKKEIV